MAIQNFGDKIEYQDDCWILPVSLTHDLLGQEWQALCNKMPRSGSWHLDAQRLQEIDSSTLSFLLECLRSAKRHAVDLKISALSQKIKALLGVYGVAHLFEKIIKD